MEEPCRRLDRANSAPGEATPRNPPPTQPHDSGYKLLFHPAMVVDLLTGFVAEDWVQELDFTTLEKQSGSYVSDDLRPRADDVVWRVRWRDRWLYVYLLLEFQSDGGSVHGGATAGLCRAAVSVWSAPGR